MSLFFTCSLGAWAGFADPGSADARQSVPVADAGPSSSPLLAELWGSLCQQCSREK